MKSKQAGFTLVEILVVLVIVGLLAGVSLPRLNTLYSSVEHAGQRSAIQAQIEGLGYRAYLNSQPIVLDSSSVATVQDYPLQLPPGWRVVLSKPPRYSSQGICGGGKLFIQAPDGGREAFRLNPPLCRLETADLD